jgi:hypothetical protein
MTDLDEFQRRVEQYFQCGQRNEPGGRIILDMMRALREAHAEIARMKKLIDALKKCGELDDALRAKIRLDIDALMDPTREPGSIP